MRNYIITGSIASGKSTVCKILKSEGYHVIDCDAIVRDTYKKGNEGYKIIKNTFGETYVNDEGVVKSQLAKLVFESKEDLEKLNELIHPIVISNIKSQLKDGVNIVETPLYFEAKKYFDFDHKVVTVYVSKETQLKRLKERNSIGNYEAQKIIDTQIDLEFKKKNSDFVIDNNGTEEELKTEVNKFIKGE